VATINDICQFMEKFAPTQLAEDWDNVGLLVGDRALPIERVMTCLTVTPETVAEAVQRRADLIVTHHPMPFRPMKRLTTDTITGGIVWQLARAGISVYSPHTGFDSAENGINQNLGIRLGLGELESLIPQEDGVQTIGAGRLGRLPAPQTLAEFVSGVKLNLSIESVRVVNAHRSPVQRVAIACGSGGSFLGKAKARGCDTLVTGEATFHTCLEAQARGVSLVLLGHFASERFAVETLAESLGASFESVEIWASATERDPLSWM
jgi:dinuclear metal center YbgI/SA1388 family protein